MISRVVALFALLLLCPAPLPAQNGKSIIYRGAQPSSLALPAVLTATLQQPDFIELPLVLSSDDVPVVYDRLTLQRTTNVERLFPGRNREDGNYYVIDFSLAELQQLSYLPDDGAFGTITNHPVSLADMLAALGTFADRDAAKVEILPLVKYPWFHANEGRDISRAVLETLIARAGSTESPLYLGCFDPDELQRIKKDTLPGLPVEVLLVQAIDREDGRETMRRRRQEWTSYNYEWLFTRLGLRVAAGYADILYLAAADIVPPDTLQQFIADSQGLKMKVFIGVATATSDDYEVLLFTLNADGLAVADAGSLRAYLDRRQEGGEAASGDAILSDPATLLQRLRENRPKE